MERDGLTSWRLKWVKTSRIFSQPSGWLCRHGKESPLFWLSITRWHALKWAYGKIIEASLPVQPWLWKYHAYMSIFSLCLRTVHLWKSEPLEVIWGLVTLSGMIPRLQPTTKVNHFGVTCICENVSFHWMNTRVNVDRIHWNNLQHSWFIWIMT